MKNQPGKDVLEQIIQNWWLIREKIYQVAFQESLTYSAETEFLEAKGRVSRKLQPLIQELGNPQEIRDVVIRFMRRISSVNQMQQLPSADLRVLEKECHHIYIRLNRWYGELDLN